jgi:ABC-type transport system involved in multi-copper enzyme maturation permease subunit
MPVAAVVSVGTKLLEEFGTSAFLSTFGLLGMLTALALGTFIASEEFADKTVQFLFTKPRSRAYFIWAGWAIGGVELFLIAIVNLSAGWLTLITVTHSTQRFLDRPQYGKLSAVF